MTNKEQKEIYMKLAEKKLDQYPLLNVEIPLVGWIEIPGSILLAVLAGNEILPWSCFFVILICCLATWAEPFIGYFKDKNSSKQAHSVVKR